MRSSIRLLKREPNAIGIILSGSGTDGAKGIQAVKEAGGITFAQDESSALFNGMPNSAIRTGYGRFYPKPWRHCAGVNKDQSLSFSEGQDKLRRFGGVYPAS
jgi:hypothetical protein